MDCPVCKNPLVILELNQIEVDYCTFCKGVWLDSGELELLLEDESETQKVLNEFKEIYDYDEKEYRCPRCRKKMQKILFTKSGEKSILIDKCKNNHGLWFDEGELIDTVRLVHTKEQNKIIEFLTEIFQYNINKKERK